MATECRHTNGNEKEGKSNGLKSTLNQCILISGCSGGGKSSLLADLSKRGYSTVEEPGRRIIAEEKNRAGKALPWINMEAFARRAVEVSKSDLQEAEDKPGFVFFDRGMVDAAVALQNTSGVPYRDTIGDKMHYAKIVFLAPPWPEIFAQDIDRRHGLNDAFGEFERLDVAFHDLGYRTCLLPKVSVSERAEFVLGHIQNQ